VVRFPRDWLADWQTVAGRIDRTDREPASGAQPVTRNGNRVYPFSSPGSSRSSARIGSSKKDERRPSRRRTARRYIPRRHRPRAESFFFTRPTTRMRSLFELALEIGIKLLDVGRLMRGIAERDLHLEIGRRLVVLVVLVEASAPICSSPTKTSAVSFFFGTTRMRELPNRRLR